MKIQVAGPGCPRCQATENNVFSACAELNLAADISHVYDIGEFAKLGVKATPAVIVDGKVLVSGIIPTVAELKKILSDFSSGYSGVLNHTNTVVKRDVMERKDPVSIKILNLPGNPDGCSCGSIACSPEFPILMQRKVEELRTALEESYPHQITVEYIDLRESPDERNSDLGQLLVKQEFPTPLVVINGEARFAGSIIINKIVKEVGKILNP